MSDCVLWGALRELDSPQHPHHLHQPHCGRQLSGVGWAGHPDRGFYRPRRRGLPGRLHRPDGQLRQWPAGNLSVLQVTIAKTKCQW